MLPPFRAQQYKARLSDKIVFNDKFTQLYFEMENPHRFEFYAGQYISLKVAANGTRRSYSICSSPDKEHGFELLFDIVPNGIGSHFLADLPFGSEVELLAPLGKFTVPEEVVHQFPLIFVATGSGIAPLRSMILDQLQIKQNKQPMILHWGLRYVEQLFWEDEFEELAEKYPNFHFHPVISQPLPEWPLCQGRVTDCLRTHQQIPNAHYFLCGNDKMVIDVMTLLQSQSVNPEFIHHEKFSSS